jgi:hypothetical protein
MSARRRQQGVGHGRHRSFRDLLRADRPLPDPHRLCAKCDILLIAVVNVFFLLATGVVWENLFPGGSVALPLTVMWLGLMVAVWVGTGTLRLKRTRVAELEAAAREEK